MSGEEGAPSVQGNKSSQHKGELGPKGYIGGTQAGEIGGIPGGGNGEHQDLEMGIG